MVLGNEMCDQTPHPSQCNTLGMEEANGNGTTRRYKRRWNGAGERPRGSKWYVIHVKSGVYQEYVKVGIKSHNIMIIGDQKQRQRIFHFQIRHVCGARHDDQEHGGDGEQAGGGTEIGLGQCITASKGIKTRCTSTLRASVFRKCNIYGTVDFIFGNAAAVFQNCSILAPLTSMALVCYDGGDRNVPWSFDRTQRMAGFEYNKPDIEEARQFTLHNFIDAASWLPSAKVPFTTHL
ncbi:LOW QUALITY PROTEIN: hypothetical protein HID58_031458 [Brassica napus]|uniref:Pectinesterase n=1 Tax=Brassica napus TaxID=3708 RepID=A0ABQ8BUG6_BRANA|nr:LOW QUALITY PROTEIN: hypothetical protein HID58_031458 [Brassica napus]